MIAVLGRGTTLARYADYHHLFDTVYIVNNWNAEIDYFGYDKFDGKKVIHVVGRGKNFLTKDKYKRLGINGVFTNSFNDKQFGKKPKFPIKLYHLGNDWKNRGYPPIGWQPILDHTKDFNNYKDMNAFIEKKYAHILPKIRKKHRCLRAWPTTGMLCVDIAMFNNPNADMYFFGYDFYRGEYLTQKNPYEHQTYEWEKSRAMRYHFSELAKEFPGVTIYFGSDTTFDLPNWNNI